MADEESIPTERICTKCDELKSLTEFVRATRGKYGRSARCKACDRKYYEQNRLSINAAQLALYHKKQEPRRQEKREALQARINSNEKRCCTCNETKPKGEFAKSASTPDRLRKRCKACSNAANKKYREENPESYKISSRNWVLRNPDRVREKSARHYARDPEKGRTRSAKWRADNPEAARESGCKARNKRRAKPEVKVHDAIGSQLRSAIKHGKNRARSFVLLGYSLQDLMRHLERQMLKGMTWDNYGEWHIDHIMPLSSFQIDSMDSPEIRHAWALSNLRPLWKSDNLSKADKVLFLV